MLIGVDLSRANRAQRTGVEWYAYHVARELAHLPGTARHQWVSYAATPLVADLKRAVSPWTERCLSWPPKYLWTQIRLSYEMRTQPPQLLFVPAHVLPRITPAKTSVTIHDVGFRRLPQLYKPIQVAYHEITTRDIVRSNAQILTVSEFSKREIMELYGAAEDRIMVTPLGVDEECVPQTLVDQKRVREQYGLNDQPFVLFIGRLEEKKNISRFVEAFLLFAESSPDVLCALGGLTGRGWREVQERIRRHPQGERVRVLGYISEIDKRALLSASLMYVQPSLYEGFGLPVLEAMACGTLVVSSTAGSLLEVGGDVVAAYADPYSVESLEAAMQRVASLSLTERSALLERGRAHAAQYTWKATAEKTLAAFERYV